MLKLLNRLTFLAIVATVGILGASFYYSTTNIRQLLTENRRLSEAIHNLTQETQIGYAVLESQTRDAYGKTISQIRFVQTAPDNPKVIVSEQRFTLSSDVIFFDALIVKFTDKLVKDGKARALYLWRRIYGEDTPPTQGQAIQKPGNTPKRYESITRSLWFGEKQIFWDAVWDLANNPKQLRKYGMTAVFGNALYIRPIPGKVYLFKVSPTGQIYPETVNVY